MATSTATMAIMKRPKTRLFQLRPVKLRPRSPESGPIQDATMFPQAHTMRPRATLRPARSESRSRLPTAATEIRSSPFNTPSRCAMRQPRMSPGMSISAEPGSGHSSTRPRISNANGKPAAMPSRKTRAPWATIHACNRSLTFVLPVGSSLEPGP
jgi:hypothetical protein